jgi:hypothetical protein
MHQKRSHGQHRQQKNEFNQVFHILKSLPNLAGYATS